MHRVFETTEKLMDSDVGLVGPFALAAGSRNTYIKFARTNTATFSQLKIRVEDAVARLLIYPDR